MFRAGGHDAKSGPDDCIGAERNGSAVCASEHDAELTFPLLDLADATLLRRYRFGNGRNCDWDIARLFAGYSPARWIRGLGLTNLFEQRDNEWIVH